MYIRTKDGIYEVEKLNLNKIVGNIKYEIIDNKLLKTMYGYEAHLYENEILNQSSNLAKLCDKFVIETNYGMCYIIDFLEEEKTYIDVKAIYGAVWTNKGLIYVAKMNEKGELELWD